MSFNAKLAKTKSERGRPSRPEQAFTCLFPVPMSFSVQPEVLLLAAVSDNLRVSTFGSDDGRPHPRPNFK